MEDQLWAALLGASVMADRCLCRRIDSKPLPVGGYGKVRDARRG